MAIHVARQPIFDRRLVVYGYELLYRGSEEDVAYKAGLDGNIATSSVMLESFFGTDVERFTGKRKAFVNFTKELLQGEMATLFPSEKLVIEVLEDVDAEEPILEKCRELKRLGYEIALDDFEISVNNEAFLEVADIIKLDFLLSDESDMISLIRQAPKRIRFLAEKLETHDAYNQARDMGFTYFQGFFLNKPETFKSDQLTPLHVNYINLIRYLNQPDFMMDEVERIIRQDVALTYRLLRLVNSVAFGMRFRINSVHRALVILGQEETRKWITLLSMMSVSDNQNEELLHQSLIRAKFGENVGKRVYGVFDDNPDSLFMLGLFSLIDAIVSRPFYDIFAQIDVVDPNILAALVDGQGDYMPYLNMMIAYERGNIDEAITIAEWMGVTSDEVAEDYQDAIGWCINVFES